MSWDSSCSSRPGNWKMPVVGTTNDAPAPIAEGGDSYGDKGSSQEAKTKKKRRKGAGDDAALSLREQALQILAMILVAWAVAIWGFKSVDWIKEQLKPFCDSSSGGEISDECIPCPDNGFCENGRLNCFAGFKKFRKLCVEDKEMDHIAGKIELQLKGRLCSLTARTICNGASGAVWAFKTTAVKMLSPICNVRSIPSTKDPRKLTDEEAQTQLRDEGLQERFKLDAKLWHLVWEKMAGSREDGFVTQNDFTGEREFKCPANLVQRYKPLPCRFREWVVAQSVTLIITSPIIVLGLSLIRKCVTSKRRKARAEQVYLQVCEELEAKALESRNIPGGESWVVVSRLRDHVLLPGERKWTPLWRQVEALVKEDSRIDQYQKKVKGEMKIVWEWQVEGALRTSARKKKLYQGPSSTQEQSDSSYKS